MKTIPFLLFAMLIGCASKPDPWVSEAPPDVSSSIDPLDPVRYPEVVRKYQVGRTVDPDNTGVMHDAHPVYRVEARSQWNLKSDRGQPVPLLNPPRDAAYVPPTTNDVVLAESNRRKEQPRNPSIKLRSSTSPSQKLSLCRIASYNVSQSTPSHDVHIDCRTFHQLDPQTKLSRSGIRQSANSPKTVI